MYSTIGILNLALFIHRLDDIWFQLVRLETREVGCKIGIRTRLDDSIVIG